MNEAEEVREIPITIERDSFCSYPKIWALGHGAIHGIFDNEIIIEEKIDGSQFSFGHIRGELRCRSKSVALNMFAPEKMFTKAVETARNLYDRGLLREGWTYRGEYLQVPKHNTLAYNRTPKDFIIGFDISTGYETYLNDTDKRIEFERLGLEVVPRIFKGAITDPNQIRILLQTASILGGQKVEGVVVKNQQKITKLGQMMIGKFVSEEFKEVHTGDWRDRVPDQKTIVEKLVLQYRTPARWNKAIQHLKEKGQLLNDPKDIGPLMKEVSFDVLIECTDEIKQKLFDWAWGNISRGLTGGLPQWYKEELLKISLNNEEIKHED